MNIAKKYSKMARKATFKRMDIVKKKGSSAEKRVDLSQAVNNRLSININTCKNIQGKNSTSFRNAPNTALTLTALSAGSPGLPGLMKKG